nr:MAG TPA: hypothetical protein [Siphovirus LN-2020-1]
MSDNSNELTGLATVRLVHGGQVAIESFLSSLPSAIEKTTDSELWSFICKVDLLQEELGDLLNPSQEDWVKRLYNILIEEWDARWLLMCLHDHGIVRLERKPGAAKCTPLERRP